MSQSPLLARPARDVVARNLEPSYQADSDGDGIVDSKDSCPDEMGLIQFGGCPYSDAQSGDAAPAAATIEEVNYDAAPADPDAIARVASVKAAQRVEKSSSVI